MICSLILGALIGWIASKLMGSRGGLIRNLILGVVGSAVGVGGACVVILIARWLFH